MGRVNNLWNGYVLTPTEQKLLTEMTLNEFKKPVSKRKTAQELMSRTLRLFSTKFKERVRKAQAYNKKIK